MAAVMTVSVMLAGCGGSGGSETAAPQGNATGEETETEGAPAASEETASSKDTLTIRIQNDPGSLDYHYSTVYLMYSLRDWVTNGLLDQEYDADGNIVSVVNDESLATEYTFDEDGGGITFKIREGVKFHNGTPLTSRDVAFSCRLYSDIADFSFINFDQIECADDYTVHIPFTEPNANALYLVGIELPIYCESYYEEIGAAENDADFYSTAMVGTGPYKVGEWSPGDHINFEANEEYFAGAPKIKNIMCRVIYENSVALMELQSGGIDLMTDPGWTEVSSVLESPDITVLENDGVAAAQLGFNMGSDKIKDIRVRQAICYAIDKNSVAIGAYEGIGEDMYTVVSSSYEYVNDYSGSWPYEYNPEKAKELLKEAGYEDGLALTMILGGDSNRETAAEIMANQLSQAGITLTIESMEGATVVQKMANETDTWDLYIRNWGRPANPYVYFESNLPESCHINLDTEKYSGYLELVNGFKTQMDDSARKELWSSFQDKYLTDYLYSYPLVQMKDYTLISSGLKGIDKVSFQTYKLKDAYFE